jgi:hypothetical protein
MRQKTKKLLQKLDDADWFTSVGRPLPAPLRGSVIVVGSWQEAVACCSSDEWSNYTLEQRNQLTMFLHAQAPERYDRWNDIVEDVKEVLVPLVERKTSILAGQLESPEDQTAVMHSVRWDILGACMELEYADVREPGFFCGLMPWYLDGRFLCGWGDTGEGGNIELYGPVDESGYDSSEPDRLKLVLANQDRLFRPKVRLPAVGKLLVY